MPPAASPSSQSTLDPRLALPTTDAEWRSLMSILPGYDPWKGAEAAGLWFVPAEAERAIGFIHEMLTHAEGMLAGTPFLLEPWQKAFVGNLFGWIRPDGSRRYREGMGLVPRKSGKTPLLSAILIYVLACDGEIGAQIYSAAADKEQAALLFRHAAGMIRNNPELDATQGGIIQVYGGMTRRSLVYEAHMSAYRALSSDAKTKHGLAPSLVVVDELHAMDDRELVDTLSTGMASKNRKNPLLLYITTADYDRLSICNEKIDYAHKVQSGEIEDLYFLPMLYEAAPDDDWTDERIWEKANPNLDVSVSREYLRAECEKAKQNPELENTFRRLHLNQKTNTNIVWMPMVLWDQSSGLDAGESPIEWRARKLVEMKGRPCVLGIDLSSSQDITACAALFPPDESEGDWTLLPWFWVPTTNARKREKQDRVPYGVWSRQGFIELVPDDYIDYSAVGRHIDWAMKEFDVREVAFDPWNAKGPAQDWHTRLGANVIEVRQVASVLAEPMKRVYGLVTPERLHHGGNPVMRWMVSNTSAVTDTNGNIRPDKEKSTERIDGVSATITAMARAMECDMTGGWGGVSFVGL